MKALGISVILFALGMAAQAASPVRVSGKEAKLWLRHVIPLPKEVAIPSAVRLAPGEAVVRVRDGATDVETHAAERLAALLGSKVQPRPAAGKFEVFLGVCDQAGKIGDLRVPGAEELAGRPNSDQAYVIAPLGTSRLVLTGLTERGVYYAATTLHALLAAQRDDQSVTIPLARVLDWPDLAERGEWGGNSPDDIEWMSAHKMNLVELHPGLTVTPEGKGQVEVSPKLLEQGHLNAFKVVPIITHLEQMEGTGIFRALPQTQGVGDPKKWGETGEVKPACFSQPATVQVLADWMTCFARQPAITDACVWLSENDIGCECDQCRAQGTYESQCAAILKAFRRAQQVRPDLKLRVLLTQGSYAVNDRVLKALPRDIGVSYYDGGKTYDSSRDPMIYPLLEEYAKSGGWLGCYPQLTASWRIVCPWSGPQFIKYRMTEFVDKKLHCLCGYATPSNRLYDFNVAAAAEWSWNSRGRDEHEFAAAWATTRGIKDPERAADWAVLLGQVGWDVYGSGVPFYQFFGSAAQMIKARSKPVLGKGMFRYFPTEERLQGDLAVCERATKLAEGLGSPVITAETQVVAGYVTMVQKLYQIASLVSRSEPPTEAERQGLQANMRALSEAGAQVTAGLQAWEQVCVPGGGGSRLGDTVNITEQTVVDVGKALRPFGVRDPSAPYLHREAGVWQTDDFEAKEAIRKTWDVTAAVSGAGTYQARFNYTSGWHGLSISRAALASAPKGQPDKLTEIAADKHDGVAACQNQANTYTIELPTHDENLSYFLVADIVGVRSSDKPADRRGCNGSVTFWKVRWPGEKLPELPLLPMDEAELSRFSGPKFTTGGLRVGIVQGGYGSEAMLAFLRTRPGLDVQPVYSLDPAKIKECQVVILPQARAPESFTAKAVAALAKFVQDGGGLVATHDAVGFRAMPPIVPEVCVKGVGHPRDDGWRADREHPVTKGLALGKTLSRSYYDQITLEPGPRGVVVAQAVPSAAPVVVCGDAGKGRYMACGLAIGLAATGDEETSPTPDEGVLLENAVRWAGGK